MAAGVLVNAHEASSPGAAESERFTSGAYFQATSCANCKKVVVVLGSFGEGFSCPSDAYVAHPRNRARPIPTEVVEESPEIAEDYAEASEVLGVSSKASAALSRRCLQAVLVEKGGVTATDTLAKQIDDVLPTLPGHIASDVDSIRNVGNFAAHPSKDTSTGEIVPVEVGEAEWNLDVLESLFTFYYVQPKESEGRRVKLNEKLARIGKPPLKEPN